eukprot:CAMPEP_0168823426 /NCGR_PEP_ID=MMETSP0726-20121227/10532_1 /TAXON_ID=265536 /ORGANISM="Amphiprora sp., Strain CCMP467" /LENGTH=48 /DNA_ID= /DNA_START= /DNA_END= /DNA_ORIENTATION=
MTMRKSPKLRATIQAMLGSFFFVFVAPSLLGVPSSHGRRMYRTEQATI